MTTKKKKLLIGAIAISTMLASAGIAIAQIGGTTVTGGSTGSSPAQLSCPGGIVRLGQVFSESASVFPGDPVPDINIAFDYVPDFFRLETVFTGTHTGTHLSAPSHFIAGATTVDQLPAKDFAWPVYVIDVRSRMANPNFKLSRQDIKNYEIANGPIPSGALVALLTGYGSRYGTPAYLDTAPGFAAPAIDFMFKERFIKGIGTDTFGPDATSDTRFAASTAVYANGGITIENMRGLEQLHINGDIVIAPTTALLNGSGFLTDPLGCRRAG